VTALVRPFRPGDEDAVLALVVAAFSGPGRDGSEEVDIVRRTWRCAAPDAKVELVAIDGDAVIAHLAAAPGTLDGHPTDVAGVAPVCVAPEYQHRGVGTVLVRELISRAETRGWPLLVVLGDPAYYGRFGFGPAGPRGLWYAPVGRDDPHFQALLFAGEDGSRRGEFGYCWEA
jgi:predicted N-acetyltransferase YhbS